MENYILIRTIQPLVTELSDMLYEAKLKSSLFILKLNSTNKPTPQNSDLVLHDQYQIEIIDNKKVGTTLIINHLNVTNIEYDYSTFDLCFCIDEGLKVLHQRVKYKRTNPEIRIDIVAALKKITEIPPNVSIATINKL